MKMRVEILKPEVLSDSLLVVFMCVAAVADQAVRHQQATYPQRAHKENEPLAVGR